MLVGDCPVAARKGGCLADSEDHSADQVTDDREPHGKVWDRWELLCFQRGPIPHLYTNVIDKW